MNLEQLRPKAAEASNQALEGEINDLINVAKGAGLQVNIPAGTTPAGELGLYLEALETNLAGHSQNSQAYTKLVAKVNTLLGKIDALGVQVTVQQGATPEDTLSAYTTSLDGLNGIVIVHQDLTKTVEDFFRKIDGLGIQVTVTPGATPVKKADAYATALEEHMGELEATIEDRDNVLNASKLYADYGQDAAVALANSWDYEARLLLLKASESCKQVNWAPTNCKGYYQMHCDILAEQGVTCDDWDSLDHTV